MSSKAVLAVVVLVAVLIGGNFTALKFALDPTTTKRIKDDQDVARVNLIN